MWQTFTKAGVRKQPRNTTSRSRTAELKMLQDDLNRKDKIIVNAPKSMLLLFFKSFSNVTTLLLNISEDIQVISILF